MPLILITGYPTSGKTHRASQIVDYFHSRISLNPANLKRQLRIHYISDATLSIPHHVYDLESKSANERSNNASEKDARAKIYAEVKRVLGRDDVVICDAAGGNYIKGWRYQLYCEAKAVHTPSCVVYVGTPIDKARAVNEARLKCKAEPKNEDHKAMDVTAEADEDPYEPSTWENLVFRYEEPNGMARWDRPLFTVLWDDDTPPLDAIWDTMIGSADGKTKITVKPNQATVSKPSLGEDYLYELDRATQEVVARIVEWTKDHAGEGGEEVRLDIGKIIENEEAREPLVVELPANRMVGLPALQRLRRQFIALNRQNTVSVTRIKESFVGYLNDSFQAA